MLEGVGKLQNMMPVGVLEAFVDLSNVAVLGLKPQQFLFSAYTN